LLQARQTPSLQPGSIPVQKPREIGNNLGSFGTAPDIQPSYGLLAASATLNYKGFFLRVAGKNLTNENYRTQSRPTVFFQGWVPPATVMISAGAKF
jgi:iron complex outermembrane recepter protein